MRQLFALLLLLSNLAAAQPLLPPCPATAIKHNCFGEEVNPSGNKYVGEWRNNKPHGRGAYLWAAGGKFVGEYRDGRRTGQGVFTFSNGNQFVGGFERDMFTGPGIEYSPDGSVLRSGTWGDDRLLVANALDTRRFPFIPAAAAASAASPSPAIAAGTTTDELTSLPPCPPTGTRRHCRGEEILADGSRYVGEFRDGAFDGFGSLEGPMSYYIGEFKGGKYQGRGVLYTPTGQILGVGRWEQGERVQSLSLDLGKFPFRRPSTAAAPRVDVAGTDRVERDRLAREVEAERAKRRELEEALARATRERESLAAPSPQAQSPTQAPTPSLLSSRDRRVALVIGNSAYKTSPLINPVNDATDIAAALRGMGIEVILRTNVNRTQMRAAVRDFGESLRRKDVGLFFFAGHGIESKGRNFLVPVEANLNSEFELEDEAVDANSVLRAMEDAGNATNIMILDACRDNPFARSWRSASRGLAQMSAPAGSFIAFATAPGSVASDGSGRNGTFTKHLLSSLRQPDLDIDRVFTRVTAGVTQETGRKQVPWKSSSLTGEFSF